MLEHTKKRHTKQVELHITGPNLKTATALKALKKLGFEPIREAIPWREAFPEVEGNEAGLCLKGARNRENITQVQLSKMTGIPQRHISEMENGKRPIGKKMAKTFGKALNTEYRVFL